MSLHYALTPGRIPVRPIKTSVKPEQSGSDEWLELTKWFSENLSEVFSQINGISFKEVEEIRIRIGQPVLLKAFRREVFLSRSGKAVNPEKAYKVEKFDLTQTLERMTYSSIYAAEEELRQGFLTLPGGHRVGITGEAVLRQGQVQTLKNISGLNLRLAKDIRGFAFDILPYLMRQGGGLSHTLILSPPQAGKTTLLRELIGLLSNGVPQIGLKGQNVGVVDERGELAGMWQGIPTYDLGYRTDVLDGCPKALGMSMLVRSMSPAIVAVDELGHSDDVAAVEDALRTGVSILSTAHAASLEEALQRPTLRSLLEEGVFERSVILSRKNGPGTVELVFDLAAGRPLFKRKLSP